MEQRTDFLPHISRGPSSSDYQLALVVMPGITSGFRDSTPVCRGGMFDSLNFDRVNIADALITINQQPDMSPKPA